MKFQCQESCGGKCCKIPKGQQLFVFLSWSDRVRLAKFLHKPVNKFALMANFTSTRFKPSGGRFWFLKPLPVAKRKPHEPEVEGQCRFLTDAGRCGVYEARPTQCRTWPMWPENMNEATQEQFTKICPGIGKGDELSEDEVNAKLVEQKRTDASYTSQRG